MNPQSVESTAGNSGVSIDIDLHPPPPSNSSNSQSAALPSTSDSTISTDSPAQQVSLRSVKSVESVSAIGAFPLGSLRVNDPQETTDHLPAPLTTPDPPPMESSDPGPAALLTGGDVFIFDDLPVKFTIGCDTLSFTTSQPSLGFRDIPPGAHLIWVAPSESTSSRSAYWIHTPEKDDAAPGQVYVKQWDKFNEVLSDPTSQAEERFQRERLGHIFGSLMPYQHKGADSGLFQANASSTTPKADPLPDFLSDAAIWYQLTFAIHPDLLNAITGKPQASWPVKTTDSVVGEASMAEEALLYAKGASQLRFTFPMDAPLINPSAEGAERTRQALDPTGWIIDTLEGGSTGDDDDHHGRRPHEDDLVGELQFAFLTGMHLGNFSCLEQWWYLATRIAFRSYGLAVERPQLARDLVQTFHAQMVYNERHLEGDVLETVAPGGAGAGGAGGTLRRALTTYKARLDEQLLSLGDGCTAAQKAVGTAFASLESWLWRLGWDLRGEYVRSGNVMLEDGEVVQAELSDFEDEDERGEFAPVVVEVRDDGREAGLVSWDK